jgi:catechol 2,3-dioxygenase-like lactoylglutathione lyase family enzyme
MIKSIKVVSVPVSDQQKSKAFYVDKLGFKLLSESSMGPDQTWIQLAPGDGGVSITLVTWFETMPAGSLRGMVLAVDDIQKAFQELQDKGVTIKGEVEDQSWGKYFTAVDPDGNELVIQEFAD